MCRRRHRRSRRPAGLRAGLEAVSTGTNSESIAQASGETGSDMVLVGRFVLVLLADAAERGKALFNSGIAHAARV